MLRICPRCNAEYEGSYRYCPPCKAAAMRVWRRSHPLSPEARRRANARSYVKSYLKRGLIEREPCEICKTTVKVQTHHPDYSRPLDVRFLCRDDHLKVTSGRLCLLPRKPVEVKYSPLGMRKVIQLAAKKIRDSIPLAERTMMRTIVQAELNEIYGEGMF